MATSEGIPSSIDIEFLELNDNPYLMKLIAEGNELVEPLLTHDEELEYIDDCNPYVLTVIKGPMTFIADDLDFLGTPWEGHCRPDFKLEKDASDNLLTLLQGKSQ